MRSLIVMNAAAPLLPASSRQEQLTLFLCGDVMTGRGIDQVLPHSCAPHLYEPVVRSALEYVELAEQRKGPIPRQVDHAYVWGDALRLLERRRPDLRIINLETSVTTSEDALPKGINYRMHPGNIDVFRAARVDCCVLANNHVLDWGEAGLHETLETLARAGIAVAGAGRNLGAAAAPAVLKVEGGGRVLVFGFGAGDSGIPRDWAATPKKAGVHRLPDFSAATLDRVAERVTGAKRPGDLALASIHWGGNWGYAIPPDHRRFAHALIDHAGIDLVHGHSSHHPKAVEVYRDRLILYGCGDFLDDYEGITGYEDFRDDLVLMYLPSLEPGTGRLLRLELVPQQIRHFRLTYPSASDRAWLRQRLQREYQRFGRDVAPQEDAFVLV
jgi:poly-gamma-glutamate capsule biosynthesis protein CapA/YwtB (metallophosphatase superfamily)